MRKSVGAVQPCTTTGSRNVSVGGCCSLAGVITGGQGPLLLLGEETNGERRLCALDLGWSFFILPFFFFFFFFGGYSTCV